jgi:putative ABC transport system permease protein
MWQEILADARYGLRVAARTPLTTAAVIVTMVLGIGVTTAVFSVVDAVLIRPLPFAGSERTVQLFGVSNGDEISSLAYPDLVDFRRTIPAIELLGIVRRSGGTYVGRTEAQQLQLAEVDSEFTRVLDLRPAAGRMFTADEFAASGAPTIVISHAFWMREFGGDPTVIGKTMQIGPTIRTIVGVLSNTRFMYPTGPLDAIMPLRIPDEDRASRGVMWLESLARLKPGVSVEQAQIALAAAARQIAIAYPDAAGKRSANAKLLRDSIIGSVSRMLMLLSLAVAAVLLTGCINVGNLLLAQASTRTREFAVRSALGGTAWRVRRQVLTETLVLAVVGGVIGILLARPLMRALVGLYPGDLPRAAEVRMDVSVVFVAVASTVLAALLASIPSLRRAAAQRLTDGFRNGAGAGSSVKTRRLEGTLISAQMAATLTLLFAATLMVKTFVSITSVNPGFDPRGTLSFLVTPSSAKHPGSLGVGQYYAEMDRSLRAVPGVIAVTTMSHVPFQLGSQTDWFMRDDVGDRGKQNPTTGVTIAAQGFERAVRLPILEGRSFTTADDSAGPRVVMINETLAKQAFPGVDPVGKTIHWSKEQWRIIGVVADAHDKSLIEAPPKMLYAHYPQRLARTRWVIVRTNAAHGADLIPPVRAALRTLDPTVPLSYVATLDDRIADSVAAHRFRAWLVGSLGLLACVLALLGIYAIVSQAVTRRTREIGIRIALGQDSASVQREVVGAAIRVAAAGTLVGVGISIAVGRSLSTFLYEVNGRDPLILGSAALLLLACCGLASFFPARRASRVDPVVALRAE